MTSGSLNPLNIKAWSSGRMALSQKRWVANSGNKRNNLKINKCENLRMKELDDASPFYSPIGTFADPPISFSVP